MKRRATASIGESSVKRIRRNDQGITSIKLTSIIIRFGHIPDDDTIPPTTTAIIDTTTSKDKSDYKNDDAIEFMSAPIEPKQAPSFDQLEECLAFVKSLPADSDVYIFCKNGRSRSGAIASAMIAMIMGWSGEATVDYVESQWLEQHSGVRQPKNMLATKIQRTRVVDFVDGTHQEEDVIAVEPPMQLTTYVFGNNHQNVQFAANTISTFTFRGNVYACAKDALAAYQFDGEKEDVAEYMQIIASTKTSSCKAILNALKVSKSKSGRVKMDSGKYAGKTFNEVIANFQDRGMTVAEDWTKEGRTRRMIEISLARLRGRKNTLRDHLVSIDRDTLIVASGADTYWCNGGNIYTSTAMTGRNFLGRIWTGIHFRFKAPTSDELIAAVGQELMDMIAEVCVRVEQ
jgi:predicted NAD-dependent protein-ADP-ribosyltransferase YbiA (DUF1768 family)